MNYIQSLIAVGVLSTAGWFMSQPLTDTAENMLIKSIQLTAQNVEDVAYIHYMLKDKEILYSDTGFPSIKDGGIDKLFKSVGYTNYYDSVNNVRVFLFNDKRTNTCFFSYSDVSGKTTMRGNCKLSDEFKEDINNTFEVEKNI